MKHCAGCGEPTGRAPQAKWCPRCAAAAQRRAVSRYMRSERGRAARRAYAATPRAKLLMGLWKERNAAHLAAYNEAYKERRPPRPSTVGQTIRCVTLGCAGTFIRTRRNGAQRFCRPCAAASKAYSSRLSDLRYKRRKGIGRFARAA